MPSAARFSSLWTAGRVSGFGPSTLMCPIPVTHTHTAFFCILAFVAASRRRRLPGSPAWRLQAARNVTARLVARGLAPAAIARLFAGLHHTILFGWPAMLAGRCASSHPHGPLFSPPQQGRRPPSFLHPYPSLAAAPLPPAPSPAALPAPPWFAIACELLGSLPPAGSSFCPLTSPCLAPLPPLPPPLLRLRAALASLPAPADVAAEPLAPGPCCISLRLWGNPLLLSPWHPAGLDSSFADFLNAGVHYLRRLLEAERAALERVAQLPCPSPGWRRHAPLAAVAGLGQLLCPRAALAGTLMLRLGWRCSDGCIPLAALTVRAATALAGCPCV